MHPVFSTDGSEIFLFDGGGLSVAAVQCNPLRVTRPETLFRGHYWYGVTGPNGGLGRAWDVDPTNDRFLMITMPDAGAGAVAGSTLEFNVVLNWFSELNARAPRR